MECIKFAGTKKGERRKTARRAYERISYDDIKQGLREFELDWSKSEREGVPVSFQLTAPEKATLLRAWNLINSRSAIKH